MWSGLSLGVTPALTAMLAPLWGRLADRYGRKIMVERSLVSFVIVMAAMAFVTRAWHVFALRADPGPLRRLRRADADDGRRVGAARPDGAGDRHRADGAAARSGARAGHRRRRRAARRAAARVPRRPRCSTWLAVVLVFVLYDEHRSGPRTRRRTTAIGASPFAACSRSRTSCC